MSKNLKLTDLNSNQLDFLNDFYEDSVNEGSYSLFAELDSLKERYQTDSKLAVGGMKEIYICEDKSTGRPVAKAILKDCEKDSAIEDFLREARITASLQHPNIIPIHDLGIDQDNQPFFTMKLIEGNTLADYLNQPKNRNDLNESLDILIKVCDAVAFAHANGVIHLDLKPENIQVSNYGEVLVCDWGLARIIGSKITEEKYEDYMLNEGLGDNLTINGFIKGSPGYMAPEQIDPKLGSKDERTDIYALGCLLYFLLTRKSTTGTPSDESLKKTLTGNIKPPSVEATVPESLEIICLKAINNQQSERYQTVDLMIKDLKSYLNGFAPTSESPSLIKQCKLFYKRNYKACLTALLFLVILLASLTFYTLQIKESQRKTQEALVAEKTAKKETQDTLESLQLANIEKSKLFDELKLKIITNAESAFDRGAYSQAMNLVSQIDTEKAKELKAKLYLLFHNFNQAKALIHDNKTHFVYKTLKSFDPLIKDGNLSADDIIVTIQNDLIYNRPFRQTFYSYYFKHFANQEDKLKVIPLLIAHEDNFQDLNFSYKYTNNGLAVDLSGNKRLRKYMWIKFLGNVTELDISDTNLHMLKFLSSFPLKKLNAARLPLSNLNGFGQLKLEELDLRGTLVNKLSSIKDMGSLKTLILPKSFPKDELKNAPKNAKIIYSD